MTCILFTSRFFFHDRCEQDFHDNMVPMPMAMYPINNTSRKFKESATKVDRVILKDVVSLCMSMKRCVARGSGILNTGKRLEGFFFVDRSASFGNFETLLHFPEEKESQSGTHAIQKQSVK